MFMKNKVVYMILIIIVLLLIFFIYFKSNNYFKNSLDDSKIYKLGYCPTMESLAKDIEEKNNNIRVYEYQDASQVLNNLKIKKIDVALVGRLSKDYEVSKDVKERRLDSGLTFVSSSKTFLDLSQIPLYKIHTYLSPEDISNYVSLENVVFYDSLKDISLENNLVLIDWNDFKEEHELVVILDKDVKVKKYRLPVFYSNYKDLNSIII